MRLTGYPLLVASSLLLASFVSAETRPHYGGTVHAALRAAPISLDPTQPDWFAARHIFPLIFDTLVALDEQGKPVPALATSWQAEVGAQRWQFEIRSGVTFADGAAATADAAAASLREANPSWKVVSTGGVVVIERDSPAPDLPSELALPRNSIGKREAGKILGTGPMVISQFDPGRKLVLAAREEYWGGRPFLDSVEIDLGKSFREQLISFDLGKAQIVEVPVEQAHSAATQGRRLQTSNPLELIALVFSRDPQSPEGAKQREVLSLSLDRKLFSSVVLQEGAEPAGGLLPNWMTGYEFLFPTEMNLTRAQQERAEVARADVWNLSYEVNDPVARVIAERVVLNARDAGLRLQLATAGDAELRLMRVPLISPDPRVALADLSLRLGISLPKFAGSSVEDLYAAESALLRSQRVIPLLHLRDATAVSEKVKGWSEGPDGTWQMSGAWLAAEKP